MLRNHEEAFTGLEAAIVLIAFVVVAAVFSYVVLGAGFFTTQKAQETIYKGAEQATTNIQLKGYVYGFTDGTANAPITKINMTLSAAPGAPAIDVTNMKIIISNATTVPYQLNYTDTAPPSAGNFYASSRSLSGDTQVLVWIPLPFAAPPSTELTLEIRPAAGGAAIPIVKTIPAYTTAVTILK